MKKFLTILSLLMFILPGCVEPSPEPDVSFDYESSTVELRIFHGETIYNATAFFNITIELNHELAPVHARNFHSHVEQGNYNVTTFHRIIDNFMIQGGDFQSHDGRGGYAANWEGYCGGIEASYGDCEQTDWTIPDEADNGLVHTACTISMAKTSQPNTGGSQFFLMPDDIDQHTWLDGVHTVFGDITDGCEHVTSISEVTTGSGDRPVMPVIIYEAEIISVS